MSSDIKEQFERAVEELTEDYLAYARAHVDTIKALAEQLVTRFPGPSELACSAGGLLVIRWPTFMVVINPEELHTDVGRGWLHWEHRELPEAMAFLEAQIQKPSQHPKESSPEQS